MKADLFRKEAVDSVQRTFDTRQNLSALPMNIKLVAAVLTLCCAAFVIWMALGDLTQVLQVDGIIYSKSGQYSVYAPSHGTVSDLLVKTGDRVRAGDVIAVIYDPDALPDAQQVEFGRHVVRTTRSGVITEVCTEGMGIDTGELLARMVSLNSSEDDQVVYAFIPAGEANLLKPGMEAQVSMRFAPREKYGYIEGYVSAIEDYTVSGERLNRSFDRDVAAAGEAYHVAQITLLPDNDSPNGFRCSNAQGAALPVTLSSACSVDIVYGSQRPYEWLLDRGR